MHQSDLKISAIVMILLMGIAISINTIEAQASSRQLIEVRPAIHHFGKIPDSHPVKCEFHLDNHSTKTVKIMHIKTNCGCTAASPQPREIEPEKSSRLLVTFDPKGRRGFARWEITIFTDLIQYPTITACFDVNILRDGYLSHNFVSFGQFERGLDTAKKIWIAPRDYPNFKVKSAEVELASGLNCFRVDYQESNYDGFYPGTRRAYCVSVAPKKDIPYGRHEGKLRIRTDIPGRETIELPLLAKVAGEIGYRPDYLPMGLVKPGKKIPRSLMVFHRKGKNFQITAVNPSLPFIKTTLREIIPGQYYQIRFAVNDKAKAAAGEFRGELTIKTSNHKMPEICIPIQGFYQGILPESSKNSPKK